MKTAGVIAIVGVCVVAAGVGIYFMTRKPKTAKIDKPVTKADVLSVLSEVDKEKFQSTGILDKMTQQELTDTYILTVAVPQMESGALKIEDLFKQYPGLQDRMEAISKKYNIFT